MLGFAQMIVQHFKVFWALSSYTSFEIFEFFKCIDRIGDFICVCKIGFEGDGHYCDNKDECGRGSHHCDVFADCYDTSGSFLCVCLEGFEGNGRVCDDINECDKGTDTCHEYGVCKNTLGSYACSCMDGYEGDGKTCKYSDACASNPCNNLNEICRSQGLSYECVCNPGYQRDPAGCVNIDECRIGETLGFSDCVQFSECTDTPGSYECHCKDGFEGNGAVKCLNINECARRTHECAYHAYCIDRIGSYD